MSWPHPILTDSGGFQVVSLGDLNAIDDDGVTFRATMTARAPIHRGTVDGDPGGARRGRRGRVRPAGPASSTDLRDVAIATERTHRWAVRSLEAHRRPDQALFGVIQGGLDPDLRRQSTAFIAGLPFDGLNIGGLAGDETPTQREAVLDLVVASLDRDPRVRYLMGSGRRRTCWRPCTAAWTCSTPCCPRGSPGTASCGSPAAGSTSATSGSATTRHRSRKAAAASSARVSAGPIWPPVPGGRAARVPARDLSQPDLHPRLHGGDPGSVAHRKPP